jgi:hypothetical protein
VGGKKMKKYSIYISKTPNEPRRVVSEVSENALDARVSRVRNCWPDHTVIVNRIVESLALVYAPKCAGDEECPEVNCSDSTGPNSPRIDREFPGKTCPESV